MGLSPQPAESDMTPDRHIRIDIQLIAISVSNSDTHFNIRIEMDSQLVSQRITDGGRFLHISCQKS